MSDLVVWHRSDLRVPDNEPVTAAAEAAGPDDRVLPVFVFDPRYYGDRGLACDARLQFMHECLASLAEQYRERDSELALLHGDPRVLRRASLSERGGSQDLSERDDGSDAGRSSLDDFE